MNTWGDAAAAFERLKKSDQKPWGNYLGFFSTWLGGYFKEPWAMVLPLDDHGFHRGDGVFEAVRVQNRAYIDLQAHLKRLENSARAIGMTLPKTLEQIEAICVELGRLTEADSGVLRLYVTRGPGGFSPAPSEVTGHQIYMAMTRMKNPDERMYKEGARAMISGVAAKDPFWSQIKSCNYLQNVMMKKECQDKGFDFAISAGKDGILCEGATENLLIVTKANEVLVPKFDYTLRGTTVSEVLKIAKGLPEVKEARLADLKLQDLLAANEAAFVGTTLGVLPIGSVDAHVFPNSRPVITKLHAELMKRMNSDPGLRTPF
jgi:4-amino-4-deoxychorismate lyase